MELRKRFDWRKVFVILYGVVFVVYVVCGINSAEAVQVEVDAELLLPEIGLTTSVVKMELDDKKLNTPDTIVGSFSMNENKTLLVGHSSTVFRDLDKLVLDDRLVYRGQLYRVTSIEMHEKKEISMMKLLEAEKVDTVVLMTCAGQDLGGGDASHRLIIEAVRI